MNVRLTKNGEIQEVRAHHVADWIARGWSPAPVARSEPDDVPIADYTKAVVKKAVSRKAKKATE